MDQQLGVVMLMRKFYPLTGGYQNQALRLAQEMIKENIRVTILTQRHGSLQPYEVYQKVPIHRVFAFKTGHPASFSYFCSSFLWMVKNRRKFQIIHANRSSSGLVAALIGFMLRKKVLYKLTRGDEVEVKALRTSLLGRMKVYCLRRFVHRFITITSGIEEDLKHLGIPQEKLARIPNGVELRGSPQHCNNHRTKAEIGWSAETKVVTFVGRLVHAKGVDWLLEVWRNVAPKERQGRLLIVGDGPERSALEAQAQSLGILDTVAFVGRQENVFKFLAITDVFVLPSRLEGNSNALLEAMSQNLPVIVADDKLGGNREIVDNQKDGYVVRLGDNGAFAETLLRLLRNPAIWSEIGNRARQKVEERFSIQSVAVRYCKVYEEILTMAALPG